MADKKLHLTIGSKSFVILFILIVCVLSSVHAQPEGLTDFYVESRFVQRLSWSGNEYVSRYEVIIEKEERGVFRQAHQEFSTASAIEISLPPGRYRYCITPYDFIGRRGRVTEWIDFEILAAVHPILYFSIPELYLSGNDKPLFLKEYVLIIYGADISSHADIFIRRENGLIISPNKAYVSLDKTEARLVFNDINIIPRNFDIVVKNPGDLEASMKSRSYISSPPDRDEARIIFDELDILPESLYAYFRIPVFIEVEEDVEIEKEPPSLKYKAIDWFLTFGYAPLFSAYNSIANYPEAKIAVPSAAMQFSFIHTAKNKSLGFGAEAVMSFYIFDTAFPDEGQSFKMNAVTIGINMIVQKLTFSEKMAFRFNFGLGGDFLFGDAVSNIPNSESFHLNIGAAFLWFITKQFCLRAGAETIFWITGDESSGALRPFLGIGFRF